MRYINLHFAYLLTKSRTVANVVGQNVLAAVWFACGWNISATFSNYLPIKQLTNRVSKENRRKAKTANTSLREIQNAVTKCICDMVKTRQNTVLISVYKHANFFPKTRFNLSFSQRFFYF